MVNGEHGLDGAGLQLGVSKQPVPRFLQPTGFLLSNLRSSTTLGPRKIEPATKRAKGNKTYASCCGGRWNDGWERGLGLQEEHATRKAFSPGAAVVGREVRAPPGLEHAAPQRVVGGDDREEVAVCGDDQPQHVSEFVNVGACVCVRAARTSWRRWRRDHEGWIRGRTECAR